MPVHRYEKLKKILKKKKCFKLACGAGNEDKEEIKKLSVIYTLAGATIIDLSANINIVNAAKEGIEIAYSIANALRKKIRLKPYLSVSIGIKCDPHIRKAKIITGKCTRCGDCIIVCRQKAIHKNFAVEEYRCIGCGNCETVCKFDAIRFNYKEVNLDKLLSECIRMGVELFELHAATENYEAVSNNWNLLNRMIKDNFLSMSLNRSIFSDKNLKDRIREAYEVAKDRLIIQADGIPMSGHKDDYNTTLQAVACADIIKKSGIPAMILVSGGTNNKTGILARQCGVEVHGVAIGSYARKIIRPFIKNKKFYSDINMIKKAISVAEGLIRSNIEALSG